MLILINGIINSGKSTAARLLAQRLRRPAIVEPDVFFNHFPLPPENPERDQFIHDIAPLCWQNALLVAKNLVRHRYNVIIPYPLYKDDYQTALAIFRESRVPIFLFTLDVDVETAATKRAKRDDPAWERGFATWQQSIGISTPPAGVLIDTNDSSPTAIVNAMMYAMEDGSARVRARKGRVESLLVPTSQSVPISTKKAPAH